ncbi:MAG: serine--tRNA ligase [bacterium]|nr:serine--tRNA ligase [bacterium]MDD5755969.1 serine--tRNA ligase [bacterium]
MLDIKKIRENAASIQSELSKRGPRYSLQGLLDKDKKRKELLLKAEELKAKRNKASEEIAALKKIKQDASQLIQEMQGVSAEVKALDPEINSLTEEINEELLNIPNLPDSSVPAGKDEKDNQVIREWGIKPSFDFVARDHTDVGETLDILDFKTAAKLSGTRFAILKNNGAMLERAIISFFLDIHIQKHGYQEIWVPFLVNPQSLQGTGQLPKFESELFKCRDDELYLIPTAEVPVTNMHRDEILDAALLPRKYVCYTACFRREAGSYGKDTRGLIRNHQFNKVELVKFAKPENSFQELEDLTHDAEEVLQLLKIPYRVVALCSGDLGFSSAKTYDLEVWMPGESRYREISSCSNFTDYQARRMNIKYRDDNKTLQFVHTLNGSGVAIGRAFAAILENYQQKDGSVLLPEVLLKYTNGIKIINKA